ncbi:MAG: hypothetical protein ACI9LM_001912 [Alteromonadaceae bacterium]|jgi:hypothetical protein
MKKLLIPFLLILSVSDHCYADSGIRDSLEEMFEITNMQQMLDSSYAQIDRAFSQMVNEDDISKKQQPIYEQHRQKINVLIKQSMSWSKIKEPIIVAYSKVYTKSEVDELNMFYKSALGQKMIKKMPELMQATMQAIQTTSMDLIPKMQALQKEFDDELRKNS